MGVWKIRLCVLYSSNAELKLLCYLVYTPRSPCLPLMCSAKCHQSSRPFFPPPSLTRIQARQFAVAHPPSHNAYRFPPLSGSRPPVSEMTFPASLCCPTDVLSETNQAKKEKENTMKEEECVKVLGHQ